MEKGQTNNPNGRPKGVPDKRNLRVAERAAELGCDPIEFLCLVVKADVERLKEAPDLNQRITAAKELASYIAPKLKSVEHTGESVGSFFEKLLERRNQSDT
jgi:hypothetical protein